MATRIGDRKKTIRAKKKAQDKKNRKKPGTARKLLSRPRSLLPKRKKPEVAQGEGRPGLTPMLFFRDLEAAIDFFNLKLAFDIVERRQSLHGETGLCKVRFAGVELALGDAEGLDAVTRDEFKHTPRGVGVHFVFTISDVDSYYGEIVARKVATKNEPNMKIWGAKEFSLVDPLEGYHFTFSEPALYR